MTLEAISDPKRWRNNSSGNMTAAYDEKEGAIRFDVEFPQHGDRWVYPEFILKPRESFRRARGVAFEIKTVPSMPKEAVFMAVMGREKEHGRAVFIRFPMPSAEWEERIISFDEFVPNPENHRNDPPRSQPEIRPPELLGPQPEGFLQIASRTRRLRTGARLRPG